MSAIQRKLIAAVLSMAVAVALLVSATMAWFTISTAPEIGGMQVSIYSTRTLLLSSDGTNYEQYLNLSQKFTDLAPLHPVSTADGLHWFLPAYDQLTGALEDTEQFIMDDALTYGNVSSLGADGSELTGYEQIAQNSRGYYVYADFWLMTEEEYGARVRLTVPSMVTDSDVASGIYGSYVLAKPALGTDSHGNYVLASEGRNAETTMRVGFLVNPTQTAGANGGMTADPHYNNEYEGNTFYIYEPNADRRSDSGKPLADDDGEVDYIAGYQFNSATYLDGNYFATQPIGVTSDGAGGTTYAPVDLDPERLLIQKASAWNAESTVDKLLHERALDSGDVAFPMGGFLNGEQIYDGLQDDSHAGSGIENAGRILNVSAAATDIAGSTPIITLKPGEPVKVRLFVWIEGQDVDCWNDIAAGSFLVNLELAGETLTAPAAGS